MCVLIKFFIIGFNIKHPALVERSTSRDEISPPPFAANAPLPQNLRGDPFRSAKVKTELCRYHNTPKGCVFGDKCNYAHGENGESALSSWSEQ
jgi:hypothetical protein